MNYSKGYIYFRDNDWYKFENVIKLGVTSSFKDRNCTYITSEIVSGKYICIIEIPLAKIKMIDRNLKSYFEKYHIYKGGGTEFYNRCIINLIESYLIEVGINFRILTPEEIELINRNNYETKNNLINPNEHQKNVLDNIKEFYSNNSIGKIIWSCGLGKTLLAIFIIKILNFKSIVIGVPSINLQKQMKNEIVKIFPNNNNILFIGSENNQDVKTTTNKKKIIKFLNTNSYNQPKFIITTYHSCYLLVNNNIIFDFKIGDEAHHLVDIEKEDKRFILFHKIISNKSLFMTATEKTIINQNIREVYSMESENIFGKYIDVKSVQWSIENKKITDYNILILKNTEEDINDIINRLKLNTVTKEIFIACYMCLKSFEKYSNLTHLLLYTNTVEHADLAVKYIKKILEFNNLLIPKDKIYYKSLHSNNSNSFDYEIHKFKNSEYGIISCVYIFGEGFDLPKLNGVCIAANMQSHIRITQYLLRPNRLEICNPNKIAYIIIPFIDSVNIETENKSFEKVKNIIYQMRNIDKSIEEKIKVYEAQQHKIFKDKLIIYNDYIYEENKDELNKIKFRLRYSHALTSNFTEEQDEYNYVKSINLKLNITSKKEYHSNKDKHLHFINNPEEYFKAKGVWTDWYDFLGCDTSKFILSKQEWINFCKIKNIKSLNDYFSACEIYNNLPKEPDCFYNNFTNILSELRFNRCVNRRNSIL